MCVLKVMIIHVGNMNNKGTQALLKSDVSLIEDTVKGEVVFSISTTDVEGVKRLLSLDAVFPLMVDIPYERADSIAKKLGFSRSSWRYKVFALASMIFMPIQMLLSAFSATSVNIGLKPFYRAALIEHMKNCNLVVSYSDENFKECASLLPTNIYWIFTWWTMLISRTWDILTAKFLGKPVIMFPNSIGCFRTRLGFLLARLALTHCDLILVREPKSIRTIDSLGIRVPKILTADTTLLLNPATKTSLETQHPVIGVSIGVYSYSLPSKGIDEFIEANSKALDEAVEKYNFNVVFLPHHVSGFRNDDLEISEMVLKRMRNKNRARIINASSVEEFKSFLSKMDIVLTSKMHPAVLALASYVPVVCIAYDDKQMGFFEQIEMLDCVLPIYNTSSENLFSKISSVWKLRNEIKTKLEKRIPALRANIRNAARQALKDYI